MNAVCITKTTTLSPKGNDAVTRFVEPPFWVVRWTLRCPPAATATHAIAALGAVAVRILRTKADGVLAMKETARPRLTEGNLVAVWPPCKESLIKPIHCS